MSASSGDVNAPRPMITLVPIRPPVRRILVIGPMRLETIKFPDSIPIVRVESAYSEASCNFHKQ